MLLDWAKTFFVQKGRRRAGGTVNDPLDFHYFDEAGSYGYEHYGDWAGMLPQRHAEALQSYMGAGAQSCEARLSATQILI